VPPLTLLASVGVVAAASKSPFLLSPAPFLRLTYRTGIQEPVSPKKINSHTGYMAHETDWLRPRPFLMIMCPFLMIVVDIGANFHKKHRVTSAWSVDMGNILSSSVKFI
jgi:hypothetical protein